MVFGQIQDRYLISEQEGTDSSCKYRPELQVSEVGFSVYAQVLNLISESDELCWVHFYFEIVTFALKQLAKLRCAGENGIVAEMLKHASAMLKQEIIKCFNDMMRAGKFDEAWHHTIFRMPPKDGDL